MNLLIGRSATAIFEYKGQKAVSKAHVTFFKPDHFKWAPQLNHLNVNNPHFQVLQLKLPSLHLPIAVLRPGPI